MITVTHCPKFGLYLASVKREAGYIEINYNAKNHPATKGEAIAYSRTERVRDMATHVLAVSTSPEYARIKANLKLKAQS